MIHQSNSLRILHVVDNAVPGGAQSILSAIIKHAPTSQRHALLVLNGRRNLAVDALPDLPERLDTRFAPVGILRTLKDTSAFARSFSPHVINLNLQMSYLFYTAFHRFCYPVPAVNVAVHALPAQIGMRWFRLLSFMRRFVAGYTVEDRITSGALRRLDVPADKIKYIPIGTDYFERVISDDSSSPYAALERPLFLNVARMVPGKGQAYLIRAFHHYRVNGGRGTLCIVGYGPLELRLKALVDELKLRDSVIFAGTQTQLVPYYRHADCYVSSSVDEGMGVVIYDAMAAGLSVVGFNAGSIDEIVTDGEHGSLVENRNVGLLATALRRVADDPEKSRRMGLNGRERIRSRYQNSQMAEAYSDWFVSLSTGK